MKKLLLVLLLFPSICFAESKGAYFKIGQFEFTYPLANTNVISLYDFWKGQGLVGAETRIVSFPSNNMIFTLTDTVIPENLFNLNFGFATSTQADGMPFVSIDLNNTFMTNRGFEKYANVGFFYGHDFKNNDNRAGIKASVALW